MNLFEMVQKTTDKESFLNFLSVLKSDYANQKDEWENWSIDAYLDAVHAWVSAFQGSELDDFNWKNPDWRLIAAIFYMGKIYE